MKEPCEVSKRMKESLKNRWIERKIERVRKIDIKRERERKR